MRNNFRKSRLLKTFLLLVVLAFALSVAVACEKTYTLTFSTGSGTSVAPITAKEGETIQPPSDPVLAGHIFEGWYLTEDFSGSPVEVPTVMPGENRTYYAKFNAVDTATLTLDPAGGTLATTVYTVEVGKPLSSVLEQVEPVMEGAEFGGWFIGNVALQPNAVMSAEGMTLTARYKANYVVEVYLEGLDGEYGQPTTEVTFEGGSDWIGEQVKLSSSVLKAPEGFILDQTMTQPITIAAGQNIYKAYFYRMEGYVYYFVNAPEGTEPEGTMDFVTVPYGASVELADSGFTIRGYRFAGWSTAPDGEVEYAAGQSIEQVSGTIMLYARWNLGATDIAGGMDRVYTLMEDAEHVVLDRAVLGEKTGAYNKETRMFEFVISETETLRGRMSADGTRFVYFDGSLSGIQLLQYDGTNVGTASIELDGLDVATYTAQDGVAVSGTYAQVAPKTYQFSSEQYNFRFRLDYTNGQDVFWMSDGVEGTYYYYNGGVTYPIILFDGFGGATYLSNTATGMLSGEYAIKDDVIEVTYPNGDGQLHFLCRTGVEQGRTTSGQTISIPVFYLADETRGEYVVSALDGTKTTLRTDGFGKAYYGDNATETSYVFNRENSYYTVFEGKVLDYYFISIELDGKTYYVGMNVDDKVAGMYEYSMLWTEHNPRSGVVIRLRMLDATTASIEVSMTNGRYQQVIIGNNTYDAENGIYHFVAQWFAPDTENIKYEQQLGPFYKDFYYKSHAATSFVIADAAESEYTIRDISSVYTLKCDGFGSGSLLLQGSTNTVPITYIFQDGYTVGNTSYDFIIFNLEMSQFVVRVDAGTKQGDIITLVSEVENRLPEVGEQFAFVAPNQDGEGRAFIRFPDGNGGNKVGIDGKYTVVIYSYTVGNTKGEYLEFTFLAENYMSGYEGLAENGYATFVFRYYPALGNYFFVYNSAEEAEYTISDGQTQIKFTVNGDGTAWLGSLLCVATLSDNEYSLTTATGARGWVRVVGDGTAQMSGSERGTYFALDNGVPSLEKDVMYLDGFGNAVMRRFQQSASGGEEQFVDVATGTYVRVNEDGGYYEYDVTFQNQEYQNFRFAYGTINLGQSAIAIYIVYDESKVESFTLSDGGTLNIDAYGEATFVLDGNSRMALVEREADDVVVGREIMRVRVRNADGNGYADEKVYAVSVEEGVNRLLLLDEGMGVYYHLDGDMINTDSKVVFDGLGNVTVYDKDQTASGRYSVGEREDEWIVFIVEGDSSSSAGNRIKIMRDMLSSDGNVFDLFAIYEERFECNLLSAKWEVVALSGYGYGTYIDGLGKAYSIYYEIINMNTIRVYSDELGEFWMTIDFEAGTFESSASLPETNVA